MRKLLLVAGVAALVVPGAALAQPSCWEQQHDNRVAGTVVGAGLGALVGSAVAGPGERGVGAVAGAVGGGAIGNAASAASTDCAAMTPTGYYDDVGVWHEASGYYDRNGDWVDTAPPAATLPPPVAGDYGADVAYTGAPGDLNAREAWLEQRIHEGDSSGALSRGDSEHDFDVLGGIRQFEARQRDRHAGLTGADRADVINKLDNLTAIVRSQWGY